MKQQNIGKSSTRKLSLRSTADSQASANNAVEEYKRAMDQNLRQSISNKDREIQQLREEALVREHQRNIQNQELQSMIQQQAAANSKLQRMLESSLRVPANVHPVQSETAAASTDPLANQTAKSPPVIAPVLQGLRQVD